MPIYKYQPPIVSDTAILSLTQNLTDKHHPLDMRKSKKHMRASCYDNCSTEELITLLNKYDQLLTVESNAQVNYKIQSLGLDILTNTFCRINTEWLITLSHNWFLSEQDREEKYNKQFRQLTNLLRHQLNWSHQIILPHYMIDRGQKLLQITNRNAHWLTYRQRVNFFYHLRFNHKNNTTISSNDYCNLSYLNILAKIRNLSIGDKIATDAVNRLIDTQLDLYRLNHQNRLYLRAQQPGIYNFVNSFHNEIERT